MSIGIDHATTKIEEQKSKGAVNRTQAKIKSSAQEPSLKGAFAAVLMLGGFLALTWVAVFVLYLARQ